MSELNREQIIKGLECFHQRILNTHLANDIRDGEMMAIIDAISLIKELTEANKRLKHTISQLGKNTDELARVLPLAKKEVEVETRADTVRKIIQRIKEDAIAVSLLSHPPKFMLEIREDALDQIAKEMLEGKK